MHYKHEMIGIWQRFQRIKWKYELAVPDLYRPKSKNKTGLNPNICHRAVIEISEMTVMQSDSGSRAMHIQNPEILHCDDSFWVGTVTIEWLMALMPSYSVLCLEVLL